MKNYWYQPEHKLAPFTISALPSEGIGTGWFYSVLGGGQDLRPKTSVERVPLSFDNTLEARMRGDFAVPTLFNGNFDAITNPEDFLRAKISQAIPGWFFHNGANSSLVAPLSNLVDWREIPGLMTRWDGESNYLEKLGINPLASNYQPNYALKLTSGESITHNRFVVPDWGVLRFNLHVPNLNDGNLTVTLTGENGVTETETISFAAADGPYDLGYNELDTYRIGYGTEGFETFHIDVPDSLRGQVATLEFEVNGGTAYLDDVFFKSQHLLLGNPVGETGPSYLICWI